MQKLLVARQEVEKVVIVEDSAYKPKLISKVYYITCHEAGQKHVRRRYNAGAPEYNKYHIYKILYTAS